MFPDSSGNLRMTNFNSAWYLLENHKDTGYVFTSFQKNKNLFSVSMNFNGVSFICEKRLRRSVKWQTMFTETIYIRWSIVSIRSTVCILW